MYKTWLQNFCGIDGHIHVNTRQVSGTGAAERCYGTSIEDAPKERFALRFLWAM